MDCGRYGHWKGDPECDFVKRGVRKPFQPAKTSAHFTGMVRWKKAIDSDGNGFWFEALPEDEHEPTDVLADEVDDFNPNHFHTGEQTGVIPLVNTVSETGATSSWVATDVATATSSSQAALSVTSRWNRRNKRQREDEQREDSIAFLTEIQKEAQIIKDGLLAEAMQAEAEDELPLPETYPQYFDSADPEDFHDAVSDEEGLAQ